MLTYFIYHYVERRKLSIEILSPFHVQPLRRILHHFTVSDKTDNFAPRIYPLRRSHDDPLEILG